MEAIKYTYMTADREQAWAKRECDVDTAIHAAAWRLDAVDIGDGEYAYYAYETRTWWVVSEEDLARLGAALLDGHGTGDDYSLWCAGIVAVEYDTLDDARAT